MTLPQKGEVWQIEGRTVTVLAVGADRYTRWVRFRDDCGVAYRPSLSYFTERAVRVDDKARGT